MGKKAIGQMWVTWRCETGKASPKAASKLGSVIFAVILLAKTLHAQVQWPHGRSYPSAQTQRKKREQIHVATQCGSRFKIRDGFPISNSLT